MRLFPVAVCAGALLLGLTAGAAASPPVSNELMLPFSGKVSTYANNDDSGGAIPTVARGKMLGVACADASTAGADVRVIMAPLPGETPTGTSGVLAIDQTVTDGTVHVRVPNVPELAQHTVHVKVYVMDKSGTHTCDAGRVKIV